ncbi:MAG: V-type ATP synthase subunit I, partial [Parachlamydiaceae bacterium]|nr:V-type ATP synthase subunit I [Parachlamydiaceae bacterium]
MRINLKKYLFLGLQTDKESFFKKAQQLGIVHFIDPKKSSKMDLPLDVERCTKAIKILRSLPQVEQEKILDVSLADDLISDLILLQDHSEEITERIRKLNDEITTIAPLGNFSFDDLNWIETIGKRKLQFFSAKKGIADSENFPDELLYVTTKNDLDYFLSVNDQPRQHRKMTELNPSGELVTLVEQRDLAVVESHNIHTKLKNYAKYKDDLYRVLAHKLDQHHLTEADRLANLSLDDTLFAVSGWVPENQMSALSDLAQKLHVYIEQVAIDPTDVVPTYLQNEGTKRIGEDLVHIYDVPSKDDADPSLWVLVFFALFFSIIVGDAGYGLVLLLAGIFVQLKYKKKTNFGQRMLKLLFILSGGIIFWGILMTSFFGITFAPDSNVRKV